MANRSYRAKQTFQTVQGKQASKGKQPQTRPGFEQLPGVGERESARSRMGTCGARRDKSSRAAQLCSEPYLNNHSDGNRSYGFPSLDHICQLSWEDFTTVVRPDRKVSLSWTVGQTGGNGAVALFSRSRKSRWSLVQRIKQV